MTRFFEFLKRQPMMTAVLALMIAMAGVGMPQESYLTRAVLRVLLTGTMLFLLSLISGEKTLSQGDNQTGYVIRQLMGFLILAAIAGVLTAVGTVVQGRSGPASCCGWSRCCCCSCLSGCLKSCASARS